MSLPDKQPKKYVFDRLGEFRDYHWNERVEMRLREALIPFGIGIHIKHCFALDIINAFPTRRYNVETHKGIWEIDLELCCKIGKADVTELLRDHLLTPSEFEEWNRREWEPWLN